MKCWVELLEARRSHHLPKSVEVTVREAEATVKARPPEANKPAVLENGVAIQVRRSSSPASASASTPRRSAAWSA
jgi:hypothetical protein